MSRADVPDTCWSTNNADGIPMLRLDMQADVIDFPVLQWGRQGRTKKNSGSWVFFCEDYRMSAVWDNPTVVLNTGCRSVVEPNFSVLAQYPRAAAAWQVYRKRWLARFWQERGTRIIVDLNVALEYSDVNMLGVPRGWRAYATRGHVDRLDDLEHEFALACGRRGSADVMFLVWGGGNAVSDLCNRRGWTHVPEPMTARKMPAPKLLPPHVETLPLFACCELEAEHVER